ncbi:MAG: LacI family DNA-binding transcriptional regulator [Clostridia bacterium]|nr:LacI family DNA-binding transcriptional regulator [Clostridia bacterium]
MSSGGNTIYDIASAAGVSITTVSRVLRGEPNVAQRTRTKVENAIEQLQYQPNAAARGMAGGKTGTLGIVLPQLLNPHYAMIYTGAVSAAIESGQNLQLFSRHDILGKGASALPALMNPHLDGIVLYLEYPQREGLEQLEKTLNEIHRSMPFVLIGTVAPELPYPAISYNMAAIMKSTVSYLTGLGHRRIAFIGGAADSTNELRRDIGYQQGLREAGIIYRDDYRIPCSDTLEAGSSALRQLLDHLPRSEWPSAVIALNDLVATGLMASARTYGLRLPDDLSVIGCDNLFYAPYLTPSLTTIDLHQQQLGINAIRLLLSGDSRRENAAWHLIERNSCRPYF